MNEFSYKNVYGSKKRRQFIDSKRYVTDDKYLDETKSCELSDGFLVEYSNYSDKQHKEKATKYTLKNAGKIIYEYTCFYSNSLIHMNIIHHKNEHRYYSFHIDRYGISYLDVDTLEVYNYIPKGYRNNSKHIFGESFLIHDIHYDSKSNLIAYGGYFRSVPCDIMVGDFSDPLNFNPHLVSISNILGNSRYGYNVGFKEWKNNRLYVLCYDDYALFDSENGYCEEKSFSVEELRFMIKKLTEKGK